MGGTWTNTLVGPLTDPAWRTHLDRIIADIAVEFVRLPVEDLDAAIVTALGRVSEHTGALGASVFLLPGDSDATPAFSWGAGHSAGGGPGEDAADPVETVAVPVWSDAGELGRLCLDLPAGRWPTYELAPLIEPLGILVAGALARRDQTEAHVAAEQAREASEAAREAAERASQAKSEFISRVSHELRTPLNAILGFTQLLELSDLPPEEAENAILIDRAGQHLLGLINDVLDFARVDSGKLPLKIEPVPVADIVSHSMGLFRKEAAAHAVTLHVTGPAGDAEDGPAVLADRQRSVQIMANLLSNAIKYNREGGQVHVTCHRRPGPRMVRISVTDTGRGIPSDRLADVFLPFERLGAELSGIQGAGVGLGLASSLAEAMGGTITVESGLDEGSTFHLDLPEFRAAARVTPQ